CGLHPDGCFGLQGMEKRFNRKILKTDRKTIVITGAESTGKSVLTQWLASHFLVPFIPELTRTYEESLNRKYNYSDIEKIAQMQIQELQELKNTDFPGIFVDTWLIITKIW